MSKPVAKSNLTKNFCSFLTYLVLQRLISKSRSDYINQIFYGGIMRDSENTEKKYLKATLSDFENHKKISAIYLSLLSKGCTDEVAKSIITNAAELHHKKEANGAHWSLFFGGLMLLISILGIIVFLTNPDVRVAGVLPLMGWGLYYISSGMNKINKNSPEFLEAVNLQIKELVASKISLETSPKKILANLSSVDSSLLNYLKIMNKICIVWIIANVIARLGFSWFKGIVSDGLDAGTIFGCILLVIPLAIFSAFLTYPYLAFGAWARDRAGDVDAWMLFTNMIAIPISLLNLRNGLFDITLASCYGLVGLTSLLNLVFYFKIDSSSVNASPPK